MNRPSLLVDVRSAIIEDPRRILHDLATGRLLSRRYVVEEVQHEERQKLRTEVRVYVLDGSGSMLGPRAKMRDGILVAELSTLIARLQDAERQLNPVLYFRYFDDKVGPTTRVDSAPAALAAIEDALSVVRTGGTNIEAALLASFAQIRAAQDTDPDLASAQIVLVTDGEAPVDAQRILAARASVAELPIGVSIIALGEENAALRRLAALQRQRGERVFYQFVGDTELTQTVSGRDAGLPIHLPRDVGLAELRGELEGILDEMAAATRVGPVTRDEDAELRLTAFDEVDLPLDDAARDAERAKLEAARRDAQAVERRFSRWFPVIETGGKAELESASGSEPDLDIVLSLLLSSAEVVELVSGSGLARQVDAIEIFERLLLDAGITPWRYAELLRREKTRMAPALAAVRTAAGA